jgi:protein O-mannosyl-transferase
VTASVWSGCSIQIAATRTLSGTAVWSYHALNLTIHVLAALSLCGLVFRTLRTAPLRARFDSAALPLSVLVAAIWMLHPLQTEAVTYVVQRAESLVGLFYLLTLYGFVRAADCHLLDDIQPAAA